MTKDVGFTMLNLLIEFNENYKSFEEYIHILEI